MKQGRGKTIRAIFIFAAAGLAACSPAPPSGSPVTPSEIEAHIRFLSDDLLEGRAVGSRGLAIAALYQEQYFRLLGLEPAFNGSYRQSFDLRGCTPDPKARMTVKAGMKTIPFAWSTDFVVKSFREDAPARVKGELVYAGFGIQAPERQWDDLKSTDVKGKVILIEINEPGNSPGGIFDGEAMTYYGRWTYKFEKAAELGAAGCLIIHNAKGAAYGWEVVQNSWTRENFFLPDKPQPLFFQGWISGEAAERIMAAAGRDRAALAAAAETKEFVPVELGLQVEAEQKCSYRSVPTSNIAGILRGTGAGTEERFIVFSAHYDHLGFDPRRTGDQIFNGAVDNCSASATMLVLARRFRDAPAKTKATLVFAAFTAEEEVMLGSEYFVRHMPFPGAAILANINIEMTGVWGETEDVYGIGAVHSDLDKIAARAAANLGLRYIPERDAELGYFFRSDQLSFARGGIPAVWIHEGIASRSKGPDYMVEKHADYVKNKYHKVTDQIEPDWDLAGTAQIARWAEEIVRELEDASAIPQFKPTSSFRRK